MRRIIARLVLVVVLLAACGDDGPEISSSGGDPGGPGSTEVDRSGDLDAEVVHLAEGVPPLDGAPGVQVYAADDPGAAELFVDPAAAAEALAEAEADLEGRTLLGGLVSEGCFSAGGVTVEVVDDAVTFRAEDLDPQEGEVDCARAVVTSALVSVATDDLPDGFGEDGRGTLTTTSEPGVEVDGPAVVGEEVPSEVVLVEPARYESDEVDGPGLIRDRVDLEALFGRYGLGEPDPALGDRLEAGESVLVAGHVVGGCALPEGGTVVRTEDGRLEWVYDVSEADPETVCDEAVSAVVIVAVDPADVEGIDTIDGAPADGPTGVGVVRAVEAVDIGTEPSAEVVDGALVFVVEACQPDTAELIADLDAGTVRAEAQQSGDRVECEALSPYRVTAELAPDHADLTPVTD